MARQIFKLISIAVAVVLALSLLSHLVAEVFWFQEVNYLPVFIKRLVAKGIIAGVATGLSAAFLFGNLAIAQRLKYSTLPAPTQPWNDPPIAYHSRTRDAKTDRSTSPLTFGWLLLILVGLSLAIGLLLLRYGQTLLDLWNLNRAQPDISPPLPIPFRLETLWQLGQRYLTSPLLIVGLLVRVAIAAIATISLLTAPQFWLPAISALSSLVFGYILSCHWGRFLLGLNPTPFDQADPVFSRDLSLYVFTLPLGQLIEFWLTGLFLLGLFSVGLTYLLAGNSLSQGKFPGFNQAQRQHLQALCGGLMLVSWLRYWLSRYELLYSPRGVVYGASFTDVNLLLPTYWVLMLLSGALALLLFWRAFGSGRWHDLANYHPWQYPFASRWLLLGFIVLALIGTHVVPEMVQQIVVQPNELEREDPYLRLNIAYTRQAFGLDRIKVETFNPQGTLTAADLEANDDTVRNIRLWDTRPLLQTNRQLQQIRPYYRFLDADIDRYTLVPEKPGDSSESQQVLISARELDYANVPEEAQTWLNEHLIYTHGYGFTLSPVNKVAAGGLPDYFVKDIGSGGDDSSLTTSSDRIRASIPIKHPRIYYGELTNTYVMTNTQVQELDYPAGNENAYNIYDGRGGVSVGALWRRWLLAYYLRDWRMVFARSFNPETKLLFRRNINQRVRAIAPFLRYDRDPYLVAANLEGQEPRLGSPPGASENYLYWIVDAYTTSDRYPYSEPAKSPYLPAENSRRFNYIRNSIKVVIDAYNGSMVFYVADSTDPMIRSWERIFPELFRPLEAMPPILRQHIRYPIDLFESQAERLLTYHMIDPQVFYNREDLWQIPTEIYGDKAQLVEPYYLITRIPAAQTEEFISILPFTPNRRTNLTGWLASRSDGANYGKSLLYVFPKQQLVYGTEQIEARINQDPVISQQISLWNRRGSRAIQGNLLVIPINNSLLYVEPLYLEAEQNSLPTLARVIVAYENRIVMAETLEQALQAIFQPDPKAPAIVRPVEE